MSGCVQPVDLAAFVEDEEVQGIIDRSAGTVILSPDSDPGLIPGNKKITGLDPAKYYLVEEWNEAYVPLGGVQFVSANGGRSASLTGIGRVSGRELTGLTNNHTYRVRAADALTGSVPYSYMNGGSSGTAAPVSGVFFISPPYGDYLLLTPTFPSPLSNYEVVSVPVSPAGSAASLNFMGTIVEPAAPGKKIDYVFYNATTPEFTVLKVVFEGAPPDPGSGGLNGGGITLDLGDTDIQLNSTITPVGGVIPVALNGTLTLTVTNATAYTTITWTRANDGTALGTGATLTFNNTGNPGTIDTSTADTYLITVNADDEESGSFTVIVAGP